MSELATDLDTHRDDIARAIVYLGDAVITSGRARGTRYALAVEAGTPPPPSRGSA